MRDAANGSARYGSLGRGVDVAITAASRNDWRSPTTKPCSGPARSPARCRNPSIGSAEAGVSPGDSEASQVLLVRQSDAIP